MSNPKAGRNSPHLRTYGSKINVSHSRLTSTPPNEEALRLIAIVDEYVKWDDGAKGTPLCMTVHGGRVCRKVEGHL